LQQAETPDQHRGSSLRLPAKSLERKLVEANIGMNALQFRMASLGLGLAGTLISWFFFIPGLPALMIGGMLVYAPLAYLNERALSRGLRIDEHLPPGFFPLVPQNYPICSAEAYYVSGFGSKRRGVGWSCAHSSETRYWQYHLNVIKGLRLQEPPGDRPLQLLDHQDRVRRPLQALTFLQGIF
jgi:hypothetical protein